MVQMMPYILPLLLGRTFNLDKMEVGIDIFPKEVVENPTLIQNPVTETKYTVVDTTAESRDLLDVEGSFSLKVKGGVFKAGASGAYLSDKYNRENTVEVAVKATYQVVTEQIPANAKPFDMWQQLGEEALGTHFVRSITYGGELIASVRMECNSSRDKQRIKGAVEVGGRIEIFDLGLEAEGEYMKDISKSVESTKIKVFSSIPLSTAPNDMKTLQQAMDGFADDLDAYNKGRGVPIKMELWPLTLLDPSRPASIKNRVLEANLELFEQKFDDLSNTKQAIADWMKVMSQPLNTDQEKKVGDFYKKLQTTIRPFYDVIGSLDVTKGSDQLKPAETAYGQSIPGVFYKEYLQLRQAVAKDQGEWTMTRGNGATYVHWGRNNCSASAETMSNGTVLGPSGYGGGANFLCLTQKPKFGEAPANLKDASVLKEASYQFPNAATYKLSCATCRLAARGTVEAFVGRTRCPQDWDFLYEGILMSGGRNSISTDFVCLDRHPADSDKADESIAKDALKTDWAFVAGDPDEKQLLMTCVVCAK